MGRSVESKARKMGLPFPGLRSTYDREFRQSGPRSTHDRGQFRQSGPLLSSCFRSVKGVSHKSSLEQHRSTEHSRRAEGTTYTFRNHGALLSLPNGGRHEDAIHTKAFEDYIRNHVRYWFQLAQLNKVGVERMEDLILVTGCTLVTSWAAAVFVDGTLSAKISLASRSHSNGSASFLWRNVQGNVSYHNSRLAVRP